MKQIYKYYEDDKYEIVKYNTNSVFIKDKECRKYYEIPNDEFNLLDKDSWNINEKNHSSIILAIYIIIFLLLFIFNIYIFFFSRENMVLNSVSFIVAITLYFPTFIFFHELGHLGMLHFFGKKADKFGFKFNYVFPAFFVRINEVYMLDKIEKLYIHSAGLFNSLILNCSLFILGNVTHIQSCIEIAMYMSADIIWNLVPMLNSDGYKLLLTLLNKNEMKIKLQGSKLILFFKIINWLFAIIYTIAFFYSFL